MTLLRPAGPDRRLREHAATRIEEVPRSQLATCATVPSRALQEDSLQRLSQGQNFLGCGAMGQTQRELRPRKKRALNPSKGLPRAELRLPKDVNQAFKVTEKQLLEALEKYGSTWPADALQAVGRQTLAAKSQPLHNCASAAAVRGNSK